jgi:predicted transcriptional regulator
MSNLRLESTSARVLNYIKENPGIHLRKIKVGLNISMGSIQYQLALLERKGKIASTRRGLYKFYFPSGVFHNTEKEILQALSSQSTREMLVFIIEQEYPTQTDIASHLQMSAASINWHAKRLIELQIIHTIKDKKNILDILWIITIVFL